MSSLSTPTVKPSPIIYVRPATAGQETVGRLLERTQEREFLIEFGSERIIARQQDLKHHAIETVQEGGVRQRFLADPDNFAAQWRQEPLTTLCDLVEAAPGALRLRSIRLEAEASGLLERGDDRAWDRLVAGLREQPRISTVDLGGAEHVTTSSTADVNDDASGSTQPGSGTTDGSEAENRTRNATLEYLVRGQPQALELASKRLAELQPETATEEVLGSLQTCLSGDETLSPRLFARLKKLAAASAELQASLLQPVLTSGLEVIRGSARTDRRELADALVSAIWAWSELDLSQLQNESTCDEIIELLQIPPSSKAWAPTGPRVATLSALAERPEVASRLNDQSVWRGVPWTALVKLLKVPPIAQLLAQEPLRDKVLRAAATARASSKDPAARRFADLVTAPEPLQQLITRDQISKLLLVMERQSVQLNEALQEREDLAVARSRPGIRSAAIAETASELSSTRGELESQTAQVASLQLKLQELESQLATTTHQLREELDRPRREATLAGERVAAQARQAQIDVFRALGDLLSALAPKADTDASVKTLWATYERRAEEIGLVGFGAPGEEIPFDPTRHESVDAPSTTVRVRFGGYELSGLPPTIVTKAVVEAT